MHKVLWILLAVFAIGGLLWITDIPREMGWWGSASEETGDNEALSDEESDERDAAVDDATSSGPVLFGLAREDRVGKGTVTGRLMRFGTSDGVARAAVSLRGTGYGNETVEQSTVSSKDGTFSFADVPSGKNYLLTVASTEGLDAQAPGVSVEANGHTDVGTLWLGEKGVLEGVVVDGAGEPIEHATIDVRRGKGSMVALALQMTDLIRNLDKDSVALKQATTDAKGRFRIEGLSPGPYTLVTRRAGYRLSSKDVVLTSHGAAGGRVRIQLATQKALRGRLVDGEGRGISRGRVACFDSNNPVSIYSGRRFADTRSDGSFVIESPPAADDLVLIAKSPEYPTTFFEAKTWKASREFVLKGGVRVTLRILDAHSKDPISNAFVSVVSAEGNGMGRGDYAFGNVVTDAQGEAQYVSRPGTLNMLLVSHPDYGRATFSPAMNPALVQIDGAKKYTMLSGPKDVTFKRPETTLEFFVRRGISVSGCVSDADGNPIAGAKVVVMSRMGASTVTSNAQGAYVFKGLSPPVIGILASAPGFVADPKASTFGAPIGGQDSHEDIESDIVLLPASVIRGRVVGPEGKPLRGVQVRVSSSDSTYGYVSMLMGTSTSITNSHGDYLLEAGAAGANVRVIARCQGFVDAKTELFALKQGAGVRTPDLVMSRGHQVVISVKTPDGEAASGATIKVNVVADDEVQWDAFSYFGDGHFAEIVSRADGTAVVHNVPTGKLTATVSLAGFAVSRASLELEDDDDQIEKSSTRPQLNLQLRDAHELRVRVVGEHGEPISGAKVTLGAKDPRASEDSWHIESTQVVSHEGTATFVGIPDIELSISATHKGMRGLSIDARGGQGSAEVRMAPFSEADTTRIQEIDAKLKEIYSALSNAKNQSERIELAKKLSELQVERARLKGEDVRKLPDDEASCGASCGG